MPESTQRYRRERLPVLLINAVCAVGVLATVWVEMSLATKIVVSVVTFVALCAGTLVQWRLIEASRESADRHDAAQSARDKLAIARHIETIRKLEAQDIPGAVDAIRAEIASLEPKPSRIEEPKLSLIFTMPNRFALRNYGGHATDVTIAPVVIDEYISDDWGSLPIKTPEQAVRFPTVDLDSDGTVEIPPMHTWFGAPLNATMAQFFEAVIKRRRVDVMGVTGQHFPDAEKATPEQLRTHSEASWRLRNEPVDIDLKVSFTSRASGRRWEIVETLHYEPATHEARVKHGQPQEVES